jgi:hypothetical protein
MPIVISCPNPSCGRRYTVPEDAAGRTASCAACGTTILISAPEIVKVSPPAPAEAPRPRPRQEDEDEVPTPSVVRRRVAPETGNGFMDFVLFRWLITPRILIGLYWIIVVVLVLGGMIVGVAGFFQGGRNVPRVVGAVVGGVLIMFLGPIIVRIAIESLIVVFRVYDTLIEIRDNTRHEP